MPGETRTRRIVRFVNGQWELDLPDEEGQPKIICTSMDRLTDVLDWLDMVEYLRNKRNGQDT